MVSVNQFFMYHRMIFHFLEFFSLFTNIYLKSLSLDKGCFLWIFSPLCGILLGVGERMLTREGEGGRSRRPGCHIWGTCSQFWPRRWWCRTVCVATLVYCSEIKNRGLIQWFVSLNFLKILHNYPMIIYINFICQ